MKTLVPRLLVLSVLAFAGSPLHGFWDSGPEFQLVADVNDDGLEDILLLDKATGQLLVGLGAGTGFAWQPSVSMGTAEVLSAALTGKVTEPLLLLTSVHANGVTVYDFDNSPAVNTGGAPTPERLAAWEEGAIALSPHGDEPGGLGPGGIWNLYGTDPFDFDSKAAGTPTAAVSKHLRHLGTDAASQTVLGMLREGGALWELHLLQGLSEPGGPAHPNYSPLPLGPAGTGERRWVSGRFHSLPGGLGQGLVYIPGQTQTYPFAITTFAGVGLEIVALSPFAFSKNVLEIRTFPEGAALRLLVRYEDGEVQVFEFDGANAPVAGQVFSPLSGVLSQMPLPRPGGGFVMLESLDDGSRRVVPYELDGGTYVRGLDETTVPRLRGPGLANLLVFQGEPFVVSQPVLLARLQSGEWTSSPVPAALPGDVQATRHSLGTEAQGILPGSPVTLTNPAGAGTHLLANQYREDVSIAFDSPASAERALLVGATPAGGRYFRSISVHLHSTQPAEIRYRLNQGSWQAYTGPIGPLYADSELRFYSVTPGGAVSPVASESYLFGENGLPVHSAGDFVPDAVKDIAGLSSFQDVDSDGDNISDLDELLMATDPGNPEDFPIGHLPSAALTTYTLHVSPLGLDSQSPPQAWRAFDHADTDTPAGASVHVWDAEGRLLASLPTVAHAEAGVASPAALFDKTPLPPPGFYQLLSTPGTFPLDGILAEPPASSAELIGFLLPPPPDESLLLFPLTGDTSAEILENWRQQMLSALESAKIRVQTDLVPLDTLVVALAEHELGKIAQTAGHTATPWISLTPTRPRERPLALDETLPPGDLLSRHPASNALLRSLQLGDANGHHAVRLRELIHDIRGQVFDDPDDEHSANLRAITRELYRFHSGRTLGPSTPFTSLLPAPFDALRHLLRHGTLPEPYAGDAALAALVNASTTAELGGFAQLPVTRPIATVDLVVSAATDFSARPLVLSRSDNPSVQVAVLDRPGSAVFGRSFALPAGTGVRVTGFTDLPPPPATDESLELLAYEIISLPPPLTQDSNNNLLDDEWELRTFGALGISSPLQDSDGDGYSDFEEMLRGSNANDPNSTPAGAPITFPPEVGITVHPDGSVKVDVDFPADFQPFIRVLVERTNDLNDWPNTGPDAHPEDSETWTRILPSASSDIEFFRVQIRLR